MGREQVGLKAETKEGLWIGFCVSVWAVFGHVSLDLVQFGLGIESDLDALV